jgi:hypothetical protein
MYIQCLVHFSLFPYPLIYTHPLSLPPPLMTVIYSLVDLGGDISYTVLFNSFLSLLVVEALDNELPTFMKACYGVIHPCLQERH